MQKRSKKKKAPEWRVGPFGFRFTVRKGRKAICGKDGKPRTFRTRDAAARVARELNGG